MNLETQLAIEHSKENAIYIANHIGQDPRLFDDLMQLFFHPEYRVSQRAAHAVSHCVDRHAVLIRPYIGKMIENLQLNPEVAIRRNTVRLLQEQEIPEKYQGLLVEKCFEYLLSSSETTAVKAFSMTILHNLCKTYPELKSELKIVIEDAIQYGTPGIVNRGNKILAQLAK